MIDFEFQSPTRFVFGREAEKKTGELVRQNGGSKVLLHFGGGSIKRTGVYDKVVASLEQAGVGYLPLGGVKPNPREDLVREGIDLVRREKIDFILAVGGGSTIDSSKAIAFGALYDGDFTDYSFGKDAKVMRPVPAALPIGTVLTIAAAGSEGSCNCVISLGPKKLKRTITGDRLRPRFSVLNPEFTFTLPPYQTACGLTDIFAHVVERYFTPTTDVLVTDELCEAVMRTVVAESAAVMKNPSDYQARANIMWAGSLAHNDLTGCGNDGGDFASHMLEHEMGGMFDVTHGAGLAAIWPSWARYVYKNCLPRFVRYAVNVMGVEATGTDEEIALKGIEAMEDFYHSIDMPTNFKELGIAPTEDQIVAMAESCLSACGGPKGSAKLLYLEDMINIYRMANR